MSSITGAATDVPTGARPTAGLFTRQSSGLVRELGILAATGIALASVALPDTLINFNAGLTSFNQVEYHIPLLAGAFIWFVAMFAYRRPRASKWRWRAKVGERVRWYEEPEEEARRTNRGDPRRYPSATPTLRRPDT